MKLNFRQGLISYQQTLGVPAFLIPGTSNFLTLNISPSPFIATIAHGTADYLLKFDTSMPNAFGPIVSGQDNYLFFQIDTISGAVTRGISLLEPITHAIEPAGAATGQMWFDLTKNVMRVKASDGRWVDSPRVLVAKVPGGNIGNLYQYPVGSSVGLNVPGNPGFPLFDSQLRPMRTSTGEMLTTDTPVRARTTIGTSGVLTTPSNNFIPVRANEPIPAMSLVYISSENGVSLASSNPALTSPRTPIGIVEQPLSLNEVGVITQVGEITYDSWNWAPSTFGKPLYCGLNGELTTTRPQSFQVYRVGFVKNSKTILFQIDSETEVQVVAVNGSTIIGTAPIQSNTTTNLIGEIVTTISIRPGTNAQSGYISAAQVQALEGFDTRITTVEGDVVALQTSKADVGHGHIIPNVAGLQTALDDKAAVNHTHLAAAITDLPAVITAAIAGKSDIGHVHPISEVTALQGELDGKAPIVHVHTIADVTNLQDALDNRAFVNHSHIISDTTGLQPALDGKAPLAHTHTLGSLTDVDLTTVAPVSSDFLSFDGTKWVPAPIVAGSTPSLPSSTVVL